METLHENLHSLWKQLGVENERDIKGEFASWETDLSAGRVTKYEEQIQLALAEKNQREIVVQELVTEIIELWGELSTEINRNDEFERSVLDGTTMFSMETIDALRMKRDRLAIEREQREEELRGYAEQIFALWNRLNISEDERKEFLGTYSGLGPAVIRACKEELTRLQELKKAGMKNLILEARYKIVGLWEELHLSEAERMRFKPGFEEDYTEESLEEHEKEIKNLEAKLNVIRPIMKMIDRREAILREKIEFETTSSDPTRLLSKKRDPGRLLREEKFRNTIEKELPKLETKLKSTLVEWENTNAQSFLFNGERYLAIMERQEDDEKAKREEERQRREKERSAKLGTESKPATPKKTPGSTVKTKSATVGAASGKALAKTSTRTSAMTPKSLMSTTHLFSVARTPELLRSTSAVLSSTMSFTSPAGTPTSASKKRPFGTPLSTNSKPGTPSERAKKSLKNLDLLSPGNLENSPFRGKKHNTIR